MEDVVGSRSRYGNGWKNAVMFFFVEEKGMQREKGGKILFVKGDPQFDSLQ